MQEDMGGIAIHTYLGLLLQPSTCDVALMLPRVGHCDGPHRSFLSRTMTHFLTIRLVLSWNERCAK
jgi:hypothetical protein